MTKDEIKQLIAAKIAGQGTNIDAASVLPSILEGIIELIPNMDNVPVIIDLPPDGTTLTATEYSQRGYDNAIAVRDATYGIIYPRISIPEAYTIILNIAGGEDPQSVCSDVFGKVYVLSDGSIASADMFGFVTDGERETFKCKYAEV